MFYYTKCQKILRGHDIQMYTKQLGVDETDIQWCYNADKTRAACDIADGSHRETRGW